MVYFHEQPKTNAFVISKKKGKNVTFFYQKFKASKFVCSFSSRYTTDTCGWHPLDTNLRDLAQDIGKNVIVDIIRGITQSGKKKQK